jgi:crotonobetainyl-CoA:carnitine CoA-transferase CaiB-like acyl-CoA transferase
VDFLSTWSALFAVGAALRHRNLTGEGQWVDLAMYQAGVMFVSEYIMDSQVNGRPGERIGNRHPYRAPQGCYPTKGEDRWIVLSVGSDCQWRALCGLMGKHKLAEDPRFNANPGRMKNHDELDAVISDWTRSRDRYHLMEQLQSVGIPAGPVFDNRDTHLDPHFKARGFLEYVSHPQDRGIGARPFIGRPYKFSKSPVKIQGRAPAFGEHNGAVVKDLLGVGDAEYWRMEQEGTIAPVPTTGEPVIPDSMEEQLRKGRISTWDPNYKTRLGVP